MWAVDDKLIYVSAVIGHRVVFLDQSKGQDVCYSLGVIPYRIRIFREITNFVGVSILRYNGHVDIVHQNISNI